MSNFTFSLRALSAQHFAAAFRNGFTLLVLLLWGPALLKAAVAPTTRANKAEVTAVTPTSATLSVSGGSGGAGTLNRLVVIRSSGTTAVAPTNGTQYLANPAFGLGVTTAATGTGNGNYVVKADASTANFTITGLTANTTYYIEVYAYTQDTGTPITAYNTSNVLTASFVTTPGTYVFSGLAANNKNTFSEPGNWAPNRTYTTTSTDILIFDGVVTPTASTTVDFGQGSNPITETVGQVKFINSVQFTLVAPTNGNTAGFLQLTGGLGDDFVIQAGSALILSNNSATTNRFVVIGLTTGQTGSIAGTLTFTTTTGPVTHRLLGASTGAIQFLGGSQFTSDIAGSPFGTTGPNSLPSPLNDKTAANSVTFQDASFFTQKNGLAPFGNFDIVTSIQTLPVTTFQNGSSYIFSGGTFSTIGQTYGFLIFNAAGIASTVGAPANTQQLLVQNDMTVTNGTLNINITGTGTGTAAPVSFGGGLNANGGILSFSASTVAFNSPISPATTAFKQAIEGSGTLNFTSSTTFEINNAQGLDLNRPVTVNGGLRFTLGLINTSTLNPLTLPSTVTSTNITLARSGNANGVRGSFVNGPVARTTTGAVSDLLFPVGKQVNTGAQTGAQNYRPMFLTTTNQGNIGTVTYRGEQIETPPTQTPLTAPLKRVSFRRYFNLAPDVVPTSSTSIAFDATVTLTFDFDDFVNYPQDNTFVIAKNDAVGGAWTNASRSVATGTANGGRPVAGTLTSALFPTTLVTNFAPYSGATASGSNFSLASTSLIAPFPGINPLPVQLTRFEARAQNSSVALDWATASEKNSERFEIERSADGTSFQAVGTVKGQGTSSSAHEYTFVDAKPLTGQAYYRLRQVDTDGTAAYSPVATVRRNAELAIYPNPTTDFVTLPAGLGAVSYRVFNGLGQTLTSGQATGGDRLDLSTLPKGAFFLELTDTAGRHTQRLMRQ